jgi:hypothetical protein
MTSIKHSAKQLQHGQKIIDREHQVITPSTAVHTPGNLLPRRSSAGVIEKRQFNQNNTAIFTATLGNWRARRALCRQIGSDKLELFERALVLLRKTWSVGWSASTSI